MMAIVKRDGCGVLTFHPNDGCWYIMPGPTGDSPLHLAIETKQAGVISLLLRAGADPTMRNKNGRSPLDNLGMYELLQAAIHQRSSTDLPAC